MVCYGGSGPVHATVDRPSLSHVFGCVHLSLKELGTIWAGSAVPSYLGQPPGMCFTAYKSSLTSWGVQGRACSCSAQAQTSRSAACMACTPGAKGQTCLLAVDDCKSKRSSLRTAVWPRGTSRICSIQSSPSRQGKPLRLSVGNGPWPVLAPRPCLGPAWGNTSWAEPLTARMSQL